MPIKYISALIANLRQVPAVAVLPLAQELEVLRSEVQNLKDRLEKKQAALSQLVDPAAGIADNLSALLRPTEEPAEFKPQRFYRTTLNGAMGEASLSALILVALCAIEDPYRLRPFRKMST